MVILYDEAMGIVLIRTTSLYANIYRKIIIASDPKNKRLETWDLGIKIYDIINIIY